MSIARRIGPIYDLEDGLRLQDLDLACGTCYKRLAEVVHDPENRWHPENVVCIDCGTLARLPVPEKAPRQVRLNQSWRAPGLRVAACTLCPRFSTPLPAQQAATWAARHLAEAHPEVAA